MDETMLVLKSGVTLTEHGGQVGLVLNDRVRYAKNERQAEILLTLVKQPQPIESLTELLCTLDGSTENDNEISLAIAEFILDFGDFLEA